MIAVLTVEVQLGYETLGTRTYYMDIHPQTTVKEVSGWAASIQEGCTLEDVKFAEHKGKPS